MCQMVYTGPVGAECCADWAAQVAGGKASTQPARPGQLEALWGTVVEGDLFASSNERKYLGFQLFTILLPHLTWAPLRVPGSIALMLWAYAHRVIFRGSWLIDVAHVTL